MFTHLGQRFLDYIYHDVKTKNQCDGLLSLAPKLIKKISVKSMKAELSWSQPIHQGFEEEGKECFCIRKTTTKHTQKKLFKMPDLKKKTPI